MLADGDTADEIIEDYSGRISREAILEAIQTDSQQGSSETRSATSASSMIVLDEHMSNERVSAAIRTWYKGKIIFVWDLRAGSVIKDDAIPQLLHKTKSKPALVTINVSHFWQKVPIDQRFCLVCLDIPVVSIPRISPLSKNLNRLFSHPDFRNKKQRIGHVFRMTADDLTRYYSHNDTQIRSFDL